MLAGADLLAKVKELGDVSKSDLVRSCGYVSTKKDGRECLNFTAFDEALLEAKGMNLGAGGGRGGKGRPGRQLSYATKVQFNGNLLIGKGYTSQLDLKPGDQLEIRLCGKKTKRESRTMLTGDDLLAKVMELGDIPHSDLALKCGYVIIKKDGTERANTTGFLEAIMHAQGMIFRASNVRPGRQLSYVAEIETNGNLLIGNDYMAELGLKPGDELEIKLEGKQINLIARGSAEDLIKLIPVGAVEEE
jgi:bifunctional DNA-binding transcriptional regulator/antitoxin component of YhaV-PrlF toxin-antitoxin module